MSSPKADPIAAERQGFNPQASTLCEQNALAPVSRLPSDLLVKIFGHCRKQSKHWIRETTHVCSGWREIAVSVSSFWATPAFAKPLLAKEMLRRSGTSPLYVSLYGEANEASEEALSMNSYRISCLNIEFASSQSFETYIELCTRPAPLLTSLSLKYRDKEEHETRVRFGSIFASDLPSLVNLTLSWCHFESLLPFSSTKLHFMHLYAVEIPLDHLHDTLRSAPQMRVLSVGYSLLDAGAADYSPSPVHLPALRRLTVNDHSPRRTLAFLAPLLCAFTDLHSNNTLSLDISNLHGFPDEEAQIAAIAAWVGASLAAPLAGVFVYGHARTIHCFPAGRAPQARSSRDFASPVNVHLHVRRSAKLVGRLFAAYLRALPWTGTTLLGVNGGGYIEPPDGGWAEIYRCARWVETLVVGSDRPYRELDALEKKDADGSVVLPRLRKVVVDDMQTRNEDIAVLWTILRNRLSVSEGTITLSLNDPYWEDAHRPFPETLREIMKADPRIHVLWQGDALDLNS